MRFVSVTRCSSVRTIPTLVGAASNRTRPRLVSVDFGQKHGPRLETARIIHTLLLPLQRLPNQLSLQLLNRLPLQLSTRLPLQLSTRLPLQLSTRLPLLQLENRPSFCVSKRPPGNGDVQEMNHVNQFYQDQRVGKSRWCYIDDY